MSSRKPVHFRKRADLDATSRRQREHIEALEAKLDRLTHELAQARANETAAIGYAGDCKADLVRSEKQLDERTRERDDARAAVCERAAHGRPGHESRHDFDEPSDAAEHFGWPDLYTDPEEGGS